MSAQRSVVISLKLFRLLCCAGFNSNLRYSGKSAKADHEHLRGLKEAYLEIEGMMEEKLGSVEGEYQGGDITILTKDDVKSWDDKVKGKIKEWKKLVSKE